MGIYYILLWKFRVNDTWPFSWHYGVPTIHSQIQTSQFKILKILFCKNSYVCKLKRQEVINNFSLKKYTRSFLYKYKLGKSWSVSRHEKSFFNFAKINDIYITDISQWMRQSNWIWFLQKSCTKWVQTCGG